VRSRRRTRDTIHPIFTTRCGASSSLPRRACEPASNVEDFALTPAERALFRALQTRGVRFMLVGLGAAVLEGAPLATQDLDVWLERLDEQVAEAARDAGGFWVSGFGAQPPAFGGDGLDRLDVVLTAHGLEGFDVEYAGAATREVDGIPLKVLPLTRIIASKRATNRPKDQAALPALEATLLARESGGEPTDG
jgi:hypothetical protein